MRLWTIMINSLGGQQPAEKQLLAFREVVDECTLNDLGYSGNQFTWCNNRGSTQCIFERLYRGLANLQWCSLFPRAQVKHRTAAYSNHVPILLNMMSKMIQRKGHKLFRFEAMWVEAPDCTRVIEEA